MSELLDRLHRAMLSEAASDDRANVEAVRFTESDAEFLLEEASNLRVLLEADEIYADPFVPHRVVPAKAPVVASARRLAATLWEHANTLQASGEERASRRYLAASLKTGRSVPAARDRLAVQTARKDERREFVSLVVSMWIERGGNDRGRGSGSYHHRGPLISLVVELMKLAGLGHRAEQLRHSLYKDLMEVWEGGRTSAEIASKL